jgi:hypothetical protein
MAIAEEGTRTIAVVDAASPASAVNTNHTTTADTDLLVCLIAIEGNEQLENSECDFDTDALTLIRDTGSTGSGSDVRLYVYAMLSPDAKTATGKVDPQFSTSPIAVVWLNFSGVDISGVVGDAIKFVSEDVNTVASSTSVMASGGTAGNGLFAWAVAQGGTGTTGASIDNSFVEILDTTTAATTSDFAYYYADLLAGAASAATVTWGGSDQNTGVLMELVLAASGGEVVNRVLTSNTIITDATPGTVLKQARPGDRIEDMNDAIFLYTAMGRLIADNFDVEDAFVIGQGLDRIIAEAATLSDIIEIVRHAFRDLSETITLADSLGVTLAIDRVASDSFAATDSQSLFATRHQVGSDNVDVSDSFEKIVTVGESSQTFVKIIEEALLLFDTPQLIFSGVVNREVADTLSVSEFIALQTFRQRLLTGDLNVSDGLRQSLLRPKLLTDDIAGRTSYILAAREMSTVVTYWGAVAGSYDVTEVTSIYPGYSAWQHENLGLLSGRSRRQIPQAPADKFIEGTEFWFWAIIENVDNLSTALGIRDQTLGTWPHLANFGWASKTWGFEFGEGQLLYEDLGTGPNGGDLAFLAISFVGLAPASGDGSEGNTNQAFVYFSGSSGTATTTGIIHHSQVEIGVDSVNSNSPIVTEAAGAVTSGQPDDTILPVRTRNLPAFSDSLATSDSLAHRVNHGRVLADGDFTVTDDVIVSRSAILNSFVASDSLALQDFMVDEFGSFLPKETTIEVDIESLGITVKITILPIEIGVVQ